MKLILASKSPRRKEILDMVGARFEIRTADVDETYDVSTPVYDVPKMLAQRKAMAIDIKDDEIIVACDTLVLCDREILGKPKTEENAVKMLEKLSGNAHYVISGLCIRSKKKCVTESVETKVFMRNFSHEEALRYVEKCKPIDKAGAYGIQEAASAFVEKIDGDFYNVVGLPLCRLCEILKESFGYNLT